MQKFTKDQVVEINNLNNKFYHSLMNLYSLESKEQIKEGYKAVVNNLKDSGYSKWVINYVLDDNASEIKQIETI